MQASAASSSPLGLRPSKPTGTNMKSNVHTPERLEGETMKQYRTRRELRRSMARAPRLLWDSYSRGTYFKSKHRLAA